MEAFSNIESPSLLNNIPIVKLLTANFLFDELRQLLLS